MWVAVAGSALVAVAWSAVHGAEPAGKSGAGAPVVLRFAVLEYPGRPAAVIAERYARRVQALSDGSTRIAIVHWPTRFARATASGKVEASAIRAVRSGEVDLGLVPTHAFEAEGVRSFRALQAPFLITSQSLAARATSGAIADRLQAGLREISLTGLGLVSEGLDRPFGFLKPLLTPADFAGVRIRADSSRATRQALRALGAEPVDLVVADSDTAVYSGFVNDARALPTAGDEFPKDAYTAAGIALFPEVDAIVVSSRAFGRLRASQRSILREAAADARAQTIALAAERAAAAAFCRGGGTIVAAPPSALRALRAKVAPLLQAMRRDRATRAIVGAIEGLEPGGRDAVAACAPAPALTVAADSENYTSAVRDALLPPDGSYRRAFTAAQLRAAGADDADARSNQGVTTLTFYGPRWSVRFMVEWQGAVRPTCRGRVGLDHRLVQLNWNPATPCSGYLAFSWKRAGHGDLTILGLDPRTEPGWVKHAYPGVWTRVDCRPWSGWPAPDPAGSSRRRACAHGDDLGSTRPRGIRGKPSFSADGKSLVVSAVGPERLGGLLIENADGSGGRWLTHNPTRGRERCPCDTRPVFAPDSKRIAFVRVLPDHEAALFVVDRDGNGLRRLTPWKRGRPGRIRWSPAAPRLER